MCNFPCICWSSIHTRVNFGSITSVDVSLMLAVPHRVCFCCNVLPGNLRSLLKIDFQTSPKSNLLYCRKKSYRKGSSIHWYSPTALLKLSAAVSSHPQHPISLTPSYLQHKRAVFQDDLQSPQEAFPLSLESISLWSSMV